MARKRIRMSALASAVHGRTWAMMEPALRSFEVRARSTSLTPKALAAVLGRSLEGTTQATYRDGVCTIPVRGDLVCYEDIWCWLGWATSYETIARDFQVALTDPKVSAILLAVDSRGGEYAGGVDLATLIASGRGVKPIVAHISGIGASAGYLIAAAADSVRISSSALAGCLGTMLAFWNTEKMDAELGIEEVVLVSSQTPNKHPDPTAADGRAQLQRMLDAQAAVMLEAIAGFRGLTVDALLTNSGRGDVLVGAGAVGAQLADQVQSYEEVHAEIATALATGQPLMTPGAPAPDNPDLPEEDDMAGEQDPKPTARLTAEQLQAQYSDELQDVRAAAVAADRARVAAIAALPAQGVEALRTACLEDAGCTVDMAARKILEAQAARDKDQKTKALGALKGDEEQIDPPAPDGGNGSEGEPTAATEAQKILAVHRKLTTRASAR